MCDPVTMTALVVASTAMQVQAQRSQAKYQQGTARYNQRVAENEAQRAREIATEKENVQRQRTAALLSKQRAQLGSMGVDLGSGSALQLQEDTLSLGEADALRIRRTGDDQFGALTQQGTLQGFKADAAGIAGRQAMAGTLLGGAASIAGTGVADKWFTDSSAAKINSGFGQSSFNAAGDSFRGR